MDVKTTFRNLVRDQSVSICMLQLQIACYHALLLQIPRTFNSVRAFPPRAFKLWNFRVHAPKHLILYNSNHVHALQMWITALA